MLLHCKAKFGRAEKMSIIGGMVQGPLLGLSDSMMRFFQLGASNGAMLATPIACLEVLHLCKRDEFSDGNGYP